MDFEWSRSKARENEHRHGFSFEEAAQAFADELSSVVVDPDHSVNEERFILFGKTFSGQISRHRVHGARWSNSNDQCPANDTPRA